MHSIVHKIIPYSLFFLCLIVSVFDHTYAQSGDVLDTQTGACSQLLSLEGPAAVKVDSTHEYRVSASGALKNTLTGSITYILRRDNKVVEKIQNREKYLRYFTTPGAVTLEAILPKEGISCEGSLKKEIRVYSSVFTYIGNERVGVDVGMNELFEKNNILYTSYIQKTSLSQSENVSLLWDAIQQSDDLVIGGNDILGFFSDMVKLQKSKEIDFSKKQLYILSSYSRSFLSKVIAFPLSELGAKKVSLLSEDQLYVLMTRAATTQEESFVGEVLSYEKSKTVYSLSRFLEFLAYRGFSYQLLAFLLSLTFVVLVLNFLKQVVGFNVFGIYYPILFAITLSSLGLSAFVFIIIGFLSIFLVNTFSKKVHLLLHAKRALLISVYIALFLLILGIDNFFELSVIRYAIFDNILIVFPLFVAVILADKIFQEDIRIVSKNGFFDFLQYTIITFVIYKIIESTTLQYFLISYPDAVILIILLNILVGRYMGLQLFEYFRFSPLLRSLNETEE